MRVVAAMWWDRHGGHGAGRPDRRAARLGHRRHARRQHDQDHARRLSRELHGLDARALTRVRSASGTAGASSSSTPRRCTEAVVALDARGFQVHQHALGDRAVRSGLDAVEAARAANGWNDARHHIAHIQLPRPRRPAPAAAARRRGEPPAVLGQPDPRVDAAHGAARGRERAARLYPIGSIVRERRRDVHRQRLAGDDAEPLARAGGRGHPAAARRARRRAARRVPAHRPRDRDGAFARGSAYVNHDDEAGVLAPGMRADLAVLDRDPFDRSLGAIGETTSGAHDGVGPRRVRADRSRRRSASRYRRESGTSATGSHASTRPPSVTSPSSGETSMAGTAVLATMSRAREPSRAAHGGEAPLRAERAGDARRRARPRTRTSSTGARPPSPVRAPVRPVARGLGAVHARVALAHRAPGHRAALQHQERPHAEPRGFPQHEVGQVPRGERARPRRPGRARSRVRRCASRGSASTRSLSSGPRPSSASEADGRGRRRRTLGARAIRRRARSRASAFIAWASCHVRRIVSPMRPMPCESEFTIEIAPRSCSGPSAAIVVARTRSRAPATSSGSGRVALVHDQDHVGVLGGGGADPTAGPAWSTSRARSALRTRPSTSGTWPPPAPSTW